MIIMRDGYRELEIKYKDLLEAYNKKSVLRVIERVADNRTLDLMTRQGDNITIYKPRKSEKGQSSKSRKRNREREAEVERLSHEPTQVISLNKPVNRYSTDSAPYHTMSQYHSEQAPIVLDHPMATNYSSANYNLKNGEPISEASQSRDEQSEESGNFKTYPVEPIQISASQRPTTTQIFQGNKVLQHTTATGNTAVHGSNMGRSNSPGDHTTAADQVNRSSVQRPQTQASHPLQHLQQGGVQYSLPPNFLQSGPERSIDFGEINHSGGAGRTPGYQGQSQQSVSSLITSGQVQEQGEEWRSRGLAAGSLNNQPVMPRIQEANSMLEYSNESISYPSRLSGTSTIRPSTLPY